MSIFVSDCEPLHWSERVDLVSAIKDAELIACRCSDTHKEIMIYGARFMVALSEPENFEIPVTARHFLYRGAEDLEILRSLVQAIKGKLSVIELETLHAGWTFAEMADQFLGNKG